MTFIPALKRLAFAALALAGAIGAAVQPARAEPALWVVKDKDSTLYLFGTVHILPTDTVWRTPKVEAALAESKELVLEIADLSSIGAQITSTILFFANGMSFKQPLTSRLNREQLVALDRAARQAGMTGQSLNFMRPWMAAMLIQAGQAVTSGMDVSAGVDMTLEKRFRTAGLPIRGFETIGEQVRIFSGMSPEDELAFLLDTIENMDVADDQFDVLVSSWEAGDLAGLERSVVSDMKKQSPVLYEALVAKRNRNWVAQIEKMMAGSGVSFIAVGAGHLVGPDGVPTLLKAQGMDVSRR